MVSFDAPKVKPTELVVDGSLKLDVGCSDETSFVNNDKPSEVVETGVPKFKLDIPG